MPNFKLKPGKGQRCDKIAIFQSFLVGLVPNFKLKPGRGQISDKSEKLQMFSASNFGSHIGFF